MPLATVASNIHRRVSHKSSNTPNPSNPLLFKRPFHLARRATSGRYKRALGCRRVARLRTWTLSLYLSLSLGAQPTRPFYDNIVYLLFAVCSDERPICLARRIAYFPLWCRGSREYGLRCLWESGHDRRANRCWTRGENGPRRFQCPIRPRGLHGAEGGPEFACAELVLPNPAPVPSTGHALYHGEAATMDGPLNASHPSFVTTCGTMSNVLSIGSSTNLHSSGPPRW